MLGKLGCWVSVSPKARQKERTSRKDSEVRLRNPSPHIRRFITSNLSINRSSIVSSLPMDLFVNAKSIRLLTHTDKYLIAEDDRLNVSLDRDGSGKNATWDVEFIEERSCLRFRSCFGTYLTASSLPFLPGVTAKKVTQTRPCQACDSATEWEPFRDGMEVRLRSAWGNFLRPNGGLPPWRNSVTHDIPFWSKTRDKILWDVEIVERCVGRRCRGQLFVRSRSATSTMDVEKTQSENIRRMLLDNQIDNSFFIRLSCCWYPKASVSISRRIL